MLHAASQTRLAQHKNCNTKVQTHIYVHESMLAQSTTERKQEAHTPAACTTNLQPCCPMRSIERPGSIGSYATGVHPLLGLEDSKRQGKRQSRHSNSLSPSSPA